MKFLIYGATKGRGDGLGRSVALTLLKRGHQVRGLCRDSKKAAQETEFPLEAVDLCTETGQMRIKQLIREDDPDVIWSACGSGYGEPLWKLPDQAIHEMIEANIRNNILFSKTCAPSCINGGPHLVLTGSVAGILNESGASVYSGVKGFIIPFVRAMRIEFLRQGRKLRISVIALPKVQGLGVESVVDTLEYLANQPSGIELLWT